MGLKRYLCAVFALMLVGASITNVAAVFADELTAEGPVGEVVNIEEPEITPGADGEELVAGDEGQEVPSEEEIIVEEEEIGEEVTNDTPVVVMSGTEAAPGLKAAPKAVETPTDETPMLRLANTYDHSMEANTTIQLFDTSSFNNMLNYRCSVSVIEGNGNANNVTCGTNAFNGRLNGDLTANAAGGYTVKVQSRWGNYGPWTDVSSYNVAVYGLSTTGPSSALYSLNSTVTYSINANSTFGDIVTTIKRDGVTIAEQSGTTAASIDTSEEGEYTIEIENTSATQAGFNEKATYTFYVVSYTNNEVMVASQDESVEISGTDRWSADYAYDWYSDEEYEADESGTITVSGLELGVHVFVSYHAFSENMIVPIAFTPMVVYSITAADPMTEGDDYEAAAETLRQFFKEHGAQLFYGASSEEEWEALWESIMQAGAPIFGNDEDGEYAMGDFIDAVFEGGAIVTGADYEEISEDEVSEELVAEVSKFDADEVRYFNVWVWMEANFDEDVYPLGELHGLNGKITVAVMDDETPDGYVRTYYVVREHVVDGETVIEVLTEGEDYFVKDGKLYIYADKFSTYAIAYKDTLAPVVTVKTSVTAPETGEATSEGASASASSNMVIAVMTVVTALTLVAAAKIAIKNKK